MIELRADGEAIALAVHALDDVHERFAGLVVPIQSRAKPSAQGCKLASMSPQLRPVTLKIAACSATFEGELGVLVIEPKLSQR